jgi:4-amino-4-deoxychorismate lyase
MWVNGQAATQLSLLDRGLAYGDGLFETILLQQGKPVWLDAHLGRLQNGCDRLGLHIDRMLLQGEITAFLEQNQHLILPKSQAVLKIMLTRQSGGRGYRAATRLCNRILTLHPAPSDSAHNATHGIKAFLCQFRLAQQPKLAGIKHLNRLEQVLASQEWPDDSYQEGVVLDRADYVIEGTRTNLFAVINQQLLTPGLDQCGVNGIMRQQLLQHFGKQAKVQAFDYHAMLEADEIFVCNSIVGVWPVVSLRLVATHQEFAIGPYARQAQQYFQSVLDHVD